MSTSRKPSQRRRTTKTLHAVNTSHDAAQQRLEEMTAQEIQRIKRREAEQRRRKRKKAREAASTWKDEILEGKERSIGL